MSDLLPKASSFSRRVECTLCGIGPDNAGIYKINGDVRTAPADIKSTNTIVRVDNRATYNLKGIKLTPGTIDCFNITLEKAGLPEGADEFEIEITRIDGALQYLKDNKIVASSFSEAVQKVMKLDSIDPKVAPLLQLPLLCNLNEGKRTAIFNAVAFRNTEPPSPLNSPIPQESFVSTALTATVSTESDKQKLTISEITDPLKEKTIYSWTKDYYCLHPTKSQFAIWSKNEVTFFYTLNADGQIIDTKNLEIASVVLLEVDESTNILFVAGKNTTENTFNLLVFNVKDNKQLKLYKLPGKLCQMYLSKEKALVFQYEYGVTENAWALRRNNEAYTKALRRDKNTPAFNMPLFDEGYLFNPEKETSDKIEAFITQRPKYIVTSLAICDKLCAAGYSDGSLVTKFFRGDEFKVTRLFYTGIVSMAFAQFGTDTYLISASNEDLQIDKVDEAGAKLKTIFRVVLPTFVNTILQMVAFKQGDDFVLWVCRKTDLLQYIVSNISGDNPTLDKDKISEPVIACAGSETHSVFATEKELFASISSTTTKIIPDYLDGGSIVDVAVTSRESNLKFVVLAQNADKQYKAYVIEAESFEKESNHDIMIDETSPNYRLAIPATYTDWEPSFVATGDVFATGYLNDELLRIDRADVKSNFFASNLPSPLSATAYNRADSIESNLDSAFLQLQDASVEYSSNLRQLAAGYDGPQEIGSTSYDLTIPENEMLLLQKEALSKMTLHGVAFRFPKPFQQHLFEFFGVGLDDQRSIFATFDSPMDLIANENAWANFKTAISSLEDISLDLVKYKQGSAFLVDNDNFSKSNLPCGTYVYFRQNDEMMAWSSLPVRACEIFKISEPLDAKHPHVTQAFSTPPIATDNTGLSHFIVDETTNQIFSLNFEPTMLLKAQLLATDIVKNAYVDVIETAAQMLDNFEDIKRDIDKITNRLFDDKRPLKISPLHQDFNTKVRNYIANQYNQLKETDETKREYAKRFFQELRKFCSDFKLNSLLDKLTGNPRKKTDSELIKLIAPGASGFALRAATYEDQQFFPVDGDFNKYESILNDEFSLEFDLQGDQAKIFKKKRSSFSFETREIATVSRSGSHFFLTTNEKTHFLKITALKDIQGLDKFENRQLLYELDAGKNKFELVQVKKATTGPFMVWTSKLYNKEYTHILVGRKYFLLPEVGAKSDPLYPFDYTYEIVEYNNRGRIKLNTKFAKIKRSEWTLSFQPLVMPIWPFMILPTKKTDELTVSYKYLKENCSEFVEEFTATAIDGYDLNEFKFIALPRLPLDSFVLVETERGTNRYKIYKVKSSGETWKLYSDANEEIIERELEKNRKYAVLPAEGTDIKYQSNDEKILSYLKQDDSFLLDKEIIEISHGESTLYISYNDLTNLAIARPTSAAFVSLPSDTGSTPLVLPEQLTLLPNFASMQLFSTATKALAFMPPFSELGPGKICDREGAIWFGKTGFADCVLKDAAKFPNCLQPSVYAAVNQGAWGSPLGYIEPTETSQRKVELVDGLARTLPSFYVSRLASFVLRRHKTAISDLNTLFKDASNMIIWLWHSGKDLLENYAECNFYLDPALQLHQCAGKSELPTPNSCNLKLYWTHQRLFDTGRLPIDARSSKKDILNFWVAHWALMIEPLPPLEPTTNVCNRIFQYVGPNLNRVLYCKGSMVCLGSSGLPNDVTINIEDRVELFAESRHNLHLRGLLTENNYDDRLELQFDEEKVKNLYMRIVGSIIDVKIKFNNRIPRGDTQKSTIKALTLHGLGDIDVLNV